MSVATWKVFCAWRSTRTRTVVGADRVGLREGEALAKFIPRAVVARLAAREDDVEAARRGDSGEVRADVHIRGFTAPTTGRAPLDAHVDRFDLAVDDAPG